MMSVLNELRFQICSWDKSEMCCLLYFLAMMPSEVNVERQEAFPGEYSYLCTSDRAVLIPREGSFLQLKHTTLGGKQIGWWEGKGDPCLASHISQTSARDWWGDRCRSRIIFMSLKLILKDMCGHFSSSEWAKKYWNRVSACSVLSTHSSGD